ncbi:hypothetical protein FB451DRAFT_1366056 [Mycena latifolia]|nr:hypothetical protein FB451DRAFT_1366056 [Mycena latifolia]
MTRVTRALGIILSPSVPLSALDFGKRHIHYFPLVSGRSTRDICLNVPTFMIAYGYRNSRRRGFRTLEGALQMKHLESSERRLAFHRTFSAPSASAETSFLAASTDSFDIFQAAGLDPGINFSSAMGRWAGTIISAITLASIPTTSISRQSVGIIDSARHLPLINLASRHGLGKRFITAAPPAQQTQFVQETAREHERITAAEIDAQIAHQAPRRVILASRPHTPKLKAPGSRMAT